MQNIIILNNQKITFDWQWVKSSQLITNENQTRNRSDIGSTSQINFMAQNLIPELLAQSFDISSGAPVIDDQNNIISGHGRIEAIKMAYHSELYINWHVNYINYKNYMHDNILPLDDYYTEHCFILCRVIDAQHNTIDAVHSANNTILSYTPYELAKINAKRLKPTINDFITSLPLFEQAQYFTNSILNNKAYDDYQAAQIIKALPSCEIMQDFINYPSSDYKNVISALLDNITLILDHQNSTTKIYQALLLALDKFLQIKNNNGNVDDFLMQLDIFDDSYNNPDFSNILTTLWNNTRSAKKLSSELGYILNSHNIPDLFDVSNLEKSNLENVNLETPELENDILLQDTPAPLSIIPRAWQQNTLDHVNNNLANNNNRLLVSAPTGAGKAILLCLIIQELMKSGKKVVLLVDRIKLFNQLCIDADKFGFDYNVISSNIKQYDNKQLTIATIQTFYSLKDRPQFDCVLIDECHTVYKGTIQHMQDNTTAFIGCTATPTTKGLKKHYPVLINEITQLELERDNILTPLVIDQQQYIDMHGAKIQAGEWIADEVTERCQAAFDSWIMDSVLHNLTTHNHAIAFCASIAHCQALQNRLNAAHITSAIYTSQQDKQERATILQDYNNSNIQVLITVATLSKGFDCKLIDLVIDLRPLRQSLAEYVQMIGRGTRINQNKQVCTILDFTGNWLRFGDSVLEMRSNGVKSAYNATWNELDEIVSTHGVNRYKAAKMAYANSEQGKQQQANIERIKNEILELQRLRNKKIKRDTPHPPQISFMGKFMSFFKGMQS